MGALVVIGAAFGVALAVGMLASRKTAPKRDAAPPPPSDEDSLWTPDALARLGTPDTVADLVAQGRAEELHGLGYDGDGSGGN